MSTIVYQGILQSCFESQIIETTTLKLKVPSSIEFGNSMIEKENNLDNVKEKCNYQVTKKPSTTTSNLDLGGGWSCLQNLSNISKDSILDKESGIYVHPLSKRSRFSEKSLQLCTESLGSETGTDIIDTSIFSFSSSYSRIEKSISSTNDDHMMTTMTHQLSESSSSRNCKVNKSSTNKKCCKKFPPPLTTIRGLNSVQFRPQREDGRLIIKAVETPLTHNYLQAERSNGRLRLCFFKDQISASSNFEENEELYESENDDDEEEEIEEKEEDTEEEEEEEEEKEENDMYNLKRDIDGNKCDMEGEMGKEKCQRLSRCKESGKRNKVFCDWRKPLWVATS